MKASYLSPILVSLALSACGGDDGISAVVDAANRMDASIDAPPIPCTISTPNFGDKGALQATATFSASETNALKYRIAFTAPLEAELPQDLFFFEIYTGYAPFGDQENPTAAVPGTYQITGNQLQYEDCSVCLTLGTNADDTTYEDDFMATGGTVTITQVGQAVGQLLNVSFSNLTFEHAFITDAHSTPVGNNCTTTITSASFMGTLEAPAMNKLMGPSPAPAKRAHHGR